jgi:hypothetical protein
MGKITEELIRDPMSSATRRPGARQSFAKEVAREPSGGLIEGKITPRPRASPAPNAVGYRHGRDISAISGMAYGLTWTI